MGSPSSIFKLKVDLASRTWINHNMETFIRLWKGSVWMELVFVNAYFIAIQFLPESTGKSQDNHQNNVSSRWELKIWPQIIIINLLKLLCHNMRNKNQKMKKHSNFIPSHKRSNVFQLHRRQNLPGFV